MIDLDADQPTMYWLFSDADGWRTDVLREPKLLPDRIVFDYPNQHTTADDYFVELKREADGDFSGGSKNVTYRCVRADTKTRVVLTGLWRSKDGSNLERGVFIAVLPINLEPV
jgi:hypothetical protein